MKSAGGRKPPIMPPRNALSAANSFGKPPPLPYREALARLRDKRRTQQQGKAKFGGLAAGDMRQSVALPFNPREAARVALIASNPSVERARAKAKRKAEEAQRRMAEEVRLAAQEGRSDDAAAPTATQATNRPPSRHAGRYDGLKVGEPG